MSNSLLQDQKHINNFHYVFFYSSDLIDFNVADSPRLDSPRMPRAQPVMNYPDHEDDTGIEGGG